MQQKYVDWNNDYDNKNMLHIFLTEAFDTESGGSDWIVYLEQVNMSVPEGKDKFKKRMGLSNYSTFNFD
jgi:hypothetical protein